jgi:hypothetical protein
VLERVLDEGGQRDSVSLDLVGEILAFVVRVGDPERDLEQGQDEDGDGEVAEE